MANLEGPGLLRVTPTDSPLLLGEVDLQVVEAECQNLFHFDVKTTLNQLRYDPERVILRAMQIAHISRVDSCAAIQRNFRLSLTDSQPPAAFYSLLISVFPLAILFDLKNQFKMNLFLQSQKLFREMAILLKEFQASSEPQETLKSFLEEQQLALRVGIDADQKERFYSEVVKLYPSVTQAPSAGIKAVLETCMRQRIYTLNNAFHAIRDPQQLANGQPLTSVEELGRTFLTESIKLHFHHLDCCEVPPSDEEFASQLSSLCAHCPSLLRRVLASGQTGNDYANREPPHLLHAFNILKDMNASPMACVLLQSILHSWGYRTELLVNSNIDPKMTDSCSHVVLLVTHPHSKRQILVDPTYKQFLKCVGGPSDLAAIGSDILVCPLDQIEQKVERLVQYCEEAKRTARSKGEDDPLRSQPLKRVRAFFRQVWGMQAYEKVTKNYVADSLYSSESYAEDVNVQRILKQLKRMGLERDPHYVAFQSRLQTLHTRCTSGQADRLPLLEEMKYLSDNYHSEFAVPLGIDVRPIRRQLPLLDVKVAGYAMAIRELVNPAHEPGKIAIYGCAGSDISLPMLAFNPGKLYLIDRTPISGEKLRTLAHGQKREGQPSESKAYENSEILIDYVQKKKWTAGGSQAVQTMESIEIKLLCELTALGVDPYTVKFEEAPEFNGVTLSFNWNYHGQAVRDYQVVYICADLAHPESYPVRLKNLLVSQAVDYYYQKASFDLPARYASYLPAIAAGIKSGGYLLTSDSDRHAKMHSPVPALASHGIEVEEEDTPLLKCYRALFKGLLPHCWIYEANALLPRNERYISPKEEYWIFSTIRKKK